MNMYYFRQALKISSPVFFGYIAIGIPFGLMMSNAGYPVWISFFMSVVMLSGTGQYIAVGLFASGAKLSTIAVAMLLINIRHIVYGLSLFREFSQAGKYKPYLIFALTDETYALQTSMTVPKGIEPGIFRFTVSALDHLYWILGGLIGAIAGRLIPISFRGVDFALTALFAVILTEQITKSKDIVPPLIGASVTVLVIAANKLGFLPAENILLVAMAFALAILSVFRHKIPEKSTESGKEEK